LLNALVEQTALAIERLALRERLEDARLHAETERLRSALLASISHDLRNPLAAIVGSASGLEQQWHKLPDEAKIALLHTIRSEADRLDVFIAIALARPTGHFDASASRWVPAEATSLRFHHPPPSAWNSAAVSASRFASASTSAMRVC
jgi:hypothetical protein